jgi:hypothetical protein
MKSRSKAVLQALAIGVGSLFVSFMVAYFVMFAGLQTPAGPRDGQAGLPEFARLLYSVQMAGVSAIVAAGFALWRLWPRWSN